MQKMMKISVGLLASILLSLLVPANAESTPQGDSKAPPLLDCEVASQRDFGTWDDAFVCVDKDMLVLRRGDTLHTLLMGEGAQPKEIVTLGALSHTRIVACIPSGERVWLLLN